MIFTFLLHTIFYFFAVSVLSTSIVCISIFTTFGWEQIYLKRIHFIPKGNSIVRNLLNLKELCWLQKEQANTEIEPGNDANTINEVGC